MGRELSTEAEVIMAKRKSWQGEGSAKREAKRRAALAARGKRLEACLDKAGQRCRTKLKYEIKLVAHSRKLDACYVRAEKSCQRRPGK